ncbi:putative disease resistance RPP13-like protein 1 [Arachis duranensis]|uniref:Disease resistance RPP13-like protein 1 n=1 Tax=Arachis duranensis TaxID=130453 RepID=A0A9C6TKC6_ARADU|nr:putative disease resistance RPP13-like protein 1 [Arachis duranensis]
MVVDVASALLSASLQVLIDRLASPQLLFFFRNKTYEAAEDLKLQLLSVNSVLVDAEEKQIVNPYVKIWLNELREALYSAEDLLDKLDTQVLEYKVRSQSHTTLDTVIDYFDSVSPLAKSLNRSLEKINLRLHVLRDYQNCLGLREVPQNLFPLLPNVPTTRRVDWARVYGRDSVKETIIQGMLGTMNEEVEPIVVAIVGMAGVGKTTLSQVLFSDEHVTRNFHIRSWVYVSEGSDVLYLTTKVYESLTGSSVGSTSLDRLQDQVASLLSGKNFLLVLDDFWAESFFDWELFKMAFMDAAIRCVILVTTRNENVAITMRAAVYFLSHLPDDDCWNIFAHYAFGNRNPEPTLLEIGHRIVRKCKGLPLAAKVLGSVLHSVTEAEEWNNILQSKMWDLPANKSNILAALRLSYQLLPSHLKACFAYCSIFPKGYEIKKLNLIHLWMAEGLLQPSKAKTMQRVGEEYLCELLSRSLLQRSTSNDSFIIMHDLISDLAQYVGGEFFHLFEDDNAGRISEKVRHLSFLQDKLDAPDKFDAFYDHSQLRTFIPFKLSNSRQFGLSADVVFGSLIPRFVCARVLSLSGYSLITLPDTIGNLKHLRYLNLSHTNIQQLPKSIGLLYNLQILLLSNCVHLTSLPESLVNLIYLHHLDIIGVPLTEMPPQFGKLKLLQNLAVFVVNRNTGSSISELGALLQLHGSLSIVNLQNIADATDAFRANLMGKKFLDELVLKWTNTIHDLHIEAAVLENLQPHGNLKRLNIENYGGRAFPGWLGNPLFSNMVSINLTGCINCSNLPPLGQLSSLKTLLIANMRSLRRVGPEFYGNIDSPFRALEMLIFEDMLIWGEWLPTEFEEFPSLKELHIKRCPLLTGNLSRHLGSLEKLVISGCHNLANSFPRVPRLRELELTDCDALMILPEEMMLGTGALRRVTICDCPLLQSFPALGLLTRLKSLHICNSRNLEFLPLQQAPHNYQAMEQLHLEGSCDDLVFFPLSSFPALRDLHIQDCLNLQSLQRLADWELPSLESILIKDCPNLMSFPEGGLPPTPILRCISISNCPNLSPQAEWGLHELTCLELFRIEGELIGLESFPDEGVLPACLNSLHITGLVNLTTLNHSGLQHLESLKLLQISGCNMLQSLPAEGLPNSLCSLIIMDCPLLAPLCEEETGEHWPLISHIPNIVIY